MVEGKTSLGFQEKKGVGVARPLGTLGVSSGF